MSQGYLSAEEVAAELGISVATVYAYVSRGLLHSEATGSQRRRYQREAVEALKARKQARRNPALAFDDVAQRALHWGTPVLDSALTLIDDAMLYYRGHSVLELAASASVEEVAGLLWTGDLAPVDLLREPGLPLPPWSAALPPYERLCAVLPVAAHADLAAYDVRPTALPRTGARLLRLLVELTIGGPLNEPVAQALATRWLLQPEAEPLVRAVLILCADHELNVSSFTARCVASAGAPLYAVVSAGLAALLGLHHGKQTELATQFLLELAETSDIPQALAQRLRLGQPIPGFGHPLYRDGDPRGKLLLELVQNYPPAAPLLPLLKQTVAGAEALLNERPTLDIGLAAVTLALGLPADGGVLLFALGRAIGWIGHAIEQYATDQLIRPRARYVGPLPTDG